MDADRWARVERLFRGAALLSAEAREAFLDRECGDDAALRREVEELVELDVQESASIAAVVGQVATEAAAASPDPEIRLGPYRLEHELGHGGMGTVYLAVRDDDTFQKRVAIKQMRFGLRQPELIRRFRVERQILATLEHPNVAGLLDGGENEAGDPYVVMEYVEGRPIDAYCDDETLSIEDRLTLFCKVCDAVQYAHEHAIVHRDIKPGNILVTATGEPKLLDFGIAKLLDPAAIPTTQAETSASMRLMTPRYASPEQIRGEPATATTDVYALGVVLYELLTGRRPYRARDGDPLALERSVCREDPVRPSVAPASNLDSARGDDGLPGTLAGARSTTPTRLRRRLSGDLDNIVLTALRKEPDRRYASARDLAEDLRRHLAGRTVRARRATVGYRLHRFVRRRPAVTALLVTLSLSVPTVLFLSAGALEQHRRERDRRIDDLLREALWLEERIRDAEVIQRADAVLALRPTDPRALRFRGLARFERSRATGIPAAERERLVAGSLADLEQLAALRDEAWVHRLRAYVLDGLGRAEQATDAEVRARQFRLDPPSDDDLEFEARLAMKRSDHETAIAALSELIRRRPDETSAIASRARLYAARGDRDAARQEYRLALGLDPTQNLTWIGLARLFVVEGAFEDARAALDRAFALRPDGDFAHEVLGHLLLEEGFVAQRNGDRETARDLFQRSATASRTGIRREEASAWAWVNLATAILSRAGLDDSPDESLLTEAIEQYRIAISRWTGVPNDPDERYAYYGALAGRCDAEIRLKRLDDALETCRRVTDLFPEQAIGFYNLAGVHAQRGDADAAIAALARNVDLGDDDWDYLQNDAWFAALREDPRFAELIRTMQERSR